MNELEEALVLIKVTWIITKVVIVNDNHAFNATTWYFVILET